ncbi:MAG: cell division protein FtsW [Rhodospirillaceae bacterium]|nr:cell division protein FtsW [Rhodospirillaceae bacterium]
MSTSLARTDTSVVGRWWWTVDKSTFGVLILLIASGAVLTLAAGRPAAARIQVDSLHFVRQQMIVIVAGLAVLVGTSLLSPRWVRRIGVIGLFAVWLPLTALATFYGPEIKGAHRWLHLGFSMQPSEFLKPCFAIFAAWMFSLWRDERGFPGWLIATVVCGVIVALLAKQPDIGMAAVVLAIWFSQVFLAGLPYFWVGASVVAGSAAFAAAYFTIPHVAHRIKLFLDPSSGDNYQVERSLDAFMNGGLLGRGPGEGTVKAQLPDAHSDFIFAVAGEEFGLIACLVIVAAYAFVVVRGLARVFDEGNLFVMFAATALLVGFGLQAFINMASALHLMPTKGMTLPFISYGGSSFVALAFGMGMVLALTRRRSGMRI